MFSAVPIFDVLYIVLLPYTQNTSSSDCNLVSIGLLQFCNEVAPHTHTWPANNENKVNQKWQTDLHRSMAD